MQLLKNNFIKQQIFHCLFMFLLLCDDTVDKIDDKKNHKLKK